eukprot:2373049-Pleurochrysis_carterae.AAC.4
MCLDAMLTTFRQGVVRPHAVSSCASARRLDDAARVALIVEVLLERLEVRAAQVLRRKRFSAKWVVSRTSG